MQQRIDRCAEADFETIGTVINDGAQAYRGVIPADRLEEPYMSLQKLQEEMNHGVRFWGFWDAATLAGVMGIQAVQDVTLIRHAYVRTAYQKQGIGAHLLTQLRQMATGPILIGTWADANWAILFYERHGFEKVSASEKNRLLRIYWTVPERQIETSVVLADQTWRDRSVLASHST